MKSRFPSGFRFPTLWTEVPLPPQVTHMHMHVYTCMYTQSHGHAHQSQKNTSRNMKASHTETSRESAALDLRTQQTFE